MFRMFFEKISIFEFKFRNTDAHAVFFFPCTSSCILCYVACIYSNIYYTYTLYTYNWRGEKEREIEVRETHRRTHTYTTHISQFKTRSSQLIPRTLGAERLREWEGFPRAESWGTVKEGEIKTAGGESNS